MSSSRLQVTLDDVLFTDAIYSCFASINGQMCDVKCAVCATENRKIKYTFDYVAAERTSVAPRDKIQLLKSCFDEHSRDVLS